MEIYEPMLIWGFAILGGLIGSFLNVCILRIPAGRSIVTPGSTCACGSRIRWFDNIPILSWLLLRGRARCCGTRISARYPFVEGITAGVFFAFALQYPPSVAAGYCIMAACLVCASFIDLDTMEIPDRFSIGLAAVGILYSAFFPELHLQPRGIPLIDGISGAIYATIGCIVASGLLLWGALFFESVLRRDAMGFGDVKLMGGIGAFLGWKAGLFIPVAASFIGLAMFALLRAIKWKGPSDESEEGRGTIMPFGPSLSVAALVYALWAHTPFNAFVERYASIFGLF